MMGMQTSPSATTTPRTRDNSTNSTTSLSTGILPSPSTALFKHETFCSSLSIPLLSVAETEPIIISGNSINYHHSLDPSMNNKSYNGGDFKKNKNSRVSVISKFTLDPAIKEEISWLYESSLLDSNANSCAKTPAIPVGWITSPHAAVSSPPVNMGRSSSSGDNTNSDSDNIAVPERSPRRLLYQHCNSYNNNSSFLSVTNEGYSSANTYYSSSNTSLASMKKDGAYLNNNSTVSSFADSSSPLHHHPYHGKLASTSRQGSVAVNNGTYLDGKIHESQKYQPNNIGSTPESMIFNNSEFNHHSFILSSGKYPELTPLDTDKDIYSSDEADWVDVSDDDYVDGDAEIINNEKAMELKMSSQRTNAVFNLKKEQEMQRMYGSANLEDVKDFKEPPLQAATKLEKENDKSPKKSSIHSFKLFFKKNKKPEITNSEKEMESNSSQSRKGQLPLPKTKACSRTVSSTAATAVTPTTTSVDVPQNERTIEVTKELKTKETRNHPVSKEIKKNRFEKTNSFIVHNTYDHASKPLPPPIVGKIPLSTNRNNIESNCGSSASLQPAKDIKTNRSKPEIPVNFEHKFSQSRASAFPQPVHSQQNEQEQQKQQPPQPYRKNSLSQSSHQYSQLARIGQPKYQINSTPIMNNYITKQKPVISGSNNNNGNSNVYGDAQFQNSTSSLSSKPTGEPLIIKVPHSLSESNSLISSNPTPVRRTPAIGANILKSPLIQSQPGLSLDSNAHGDAAALKEDASKRKSSQFYFVSSYESQPSKVPPKRNSKRVIFPQSPKQPKIQCDSCSTDMFPISPSLSESDAEDFKQIKEQYLSEPSTPGSIAFSNRFSVNSFNQNPFRRSNNPFFTYAGAAVGADGSTWPANGQNVKVNDNKTVTIKTIKNPQMLGSGYVYYGGRPMSMNSITTMVEKPVVDSNDMNGDSASANNNSTNSTSHNHRSHSTALSTIPDVNEDLEEDAIHEAQTSLIPDDDLNSLQESLNQDYRLKKQQRVLLQLQDFDSRATGSSCTSNQSVTPLKNKRMTFSLLYNSFYNQENPDNGCQQQQQQPISRQSVAYTSGINKASYHYSGSVCHSAAELKHFSKLLGSDILSNRYRKSVDSSNVPSSNDDNNSSATNCGGKLDPKSFEQVFENENPGNHCSSKEHDNGDSCNGMRNQFFDEKYQYQQQEKLRKTLFNYVTCKNC